MSLPFAPSTLAISMSSGPLVSGTSVFVNEKAPSAGEAAAGTVKPTTSSARQKRRARVSKACGLEMWRKLSDSLDEIRLPCHAP